MIEPNQKGAQLEMSPIGNEPCVHGTLLAATQTCAVAPQAWRAAGLARLLGPYGEKTNKQIRSWAATTTCTPCGGKALHFNPCDLEASAYTRSPLQDSRLFGPRPWKILATTYEQKEQPRPWRKSCKRESCYGDRVYQCCCHQRQ